MTTDTLRQVFGTLRTPNGSPFPNKSLKWFRERRTAVAQGSSVVLDDPFIVTTDASGEIDTSVMAGAYLVLAPLSDADRYFRVVVPDQAGPFDISSLIDGPTVEPDDLTQFEALVAKAKAWANAPEDSVVESGEFSAKHYAAKAEEERLGAQTAVDAAVAAALSKAEEWAENPEDSEVEAGKYSAKHWAAKSEDEKLAAQLARAGAETAEANAEAARDAAFVNATVYASTAAGLAATTTGQQFQVVMGQEIIRYRRDAGPVATEVARYPTAAKVAPLLSIAPTGYAYAVVDGFGLVAFGVKDDGTVQIASINGKNVDEWLVETERAGALIAPYPQGYKLAVVDQYGRAAAGVKDDGTLAAAKLEATFLNGVSVASIVAGGGGGAASYRSRFPSEINMVLSYGQSLSVGADGVPPISTTQRFDNLRFAGGVRTQDSATPYTSLVPLIETQVSTTGETPITGATDMIKELIAAEDGLTYTEHAFQLLGSAPGAGGTAIAGLSSGTGPFNRFVADVQNGYTLAQAAGKSFKVGGFFWTQAESDYIGNTPKATYKTALVTLRNNLDTQIKAITGQTEPVVCISYQVQGHAVYGYPGNPYLAVAQLEVAKENPHHYVACPLYWSGQSVHQSAQNYKRLGAYYGLAYKRIVIDGEDWKPVMPVQIDRQGTIILARFNVPRGPLVLDTAFRPMQADYGFSVVDSAGAAVTISSVALVGPDTVKIVTASAATGGRLRYGFTNGGNLRDSQGDTIIFDGNGQNFPLHNWCCIFDEAMN